MMNKQIRIAVAAVATIATVTLPMVTLPAFAQMDWLTPKIESDRAGRAQRMRLLRKQRNRKTSAGTAAGRRRRVSRNRNTPATPKAPERFPDVQVNGQRLRSVVAPVQINGNTFVPFREIFEALGATVTYSREDRLITATRGTSRTLLSLPGGDKSLLKRGKQSFSPSEMPFTRQGATMVPLRMVSEKMGARVAFVPRPTAPLIAITSKPALSAEAAR